MKQAVSAQRHDTPSAWHDLRKTKDRLYCQQKLDAADAKSQVAYWQNRGGFRRVSMITENRGQL